MATAKTATAIATIANVGTVAATAAPVAATATVAPAAPAAPAFATAPMGARVSHLMLTPHGAGALVACNGAAPSTAKGAPMLARAAWAFGLAYASANGVAPTAGAVVTAAAFTAAGATVGLNAGHAQGSAVGCSPKHAAGRASHKGVCGAGALPLQSVVPA